MADARRHYLDLIRLDGVRMTPELAAAFGSVPRELFVPEGFRRRDGGWVAPGDPDFLPTVYRNDVLVTKLNGDRPVSSSSQPSLMAIMLRELDVRPGMRVLEIGAGTGYNAALMATLGATVTSVDVQEDVADRARSALVRSGIAGVRVVAGDGYLGDPGEQYDRVIVTVGVTGLSPHWFEQLTPDGLVVAPVEHAGHHPVLAARPGNSAAGPGNRVAGSGGPGNPEAGSGESATSTGPSTPVPGTAAVTARVVCSAGFMAAAGPLGVRHAGSHPPPALGARHTGHDPAGAAVPELVETAPARWKPSLDPAAYRDLWYAAGAWHRRATLANLSDFEQARLALLDESDTGGAMILPDGSVLAGGDEADRYAEIATSVIDRWWDLGRPPMRAWQVGLALGGDPSAPIWAPRTWQVVPG
ncbi:protein-L-isoaspartate O-methyltransferase family protein [Actinoplanes sp. HUAS TT8]|uniref:protein-L-isoaspartate O-methyltransferase family protein n=1 Tax=Actinoplanes sp. HUAS TT8 TaxID=3447453 RepID=UPI003F51C1B6